MNNQPLFTSVSFGIGDYQLTCSIQQKKLKISVSSLNQNQRTTLSLSEFIHNDEAIRFWVSRRVEHQNRSIRQVNGETQSEAVNNAFLMKKIELLERNYRNLEYKLQLQTQERKEWWKNRKNEAKNSFSPSNCLLPSPGKNNKYSANKLGQILTQKDQEIYLLQRKVNERDELVRQLADGLMAANSEKQEIFSQYQKMLQTVVFQKADQTIVVPIIVKEETNPSQQQTQQTKPQATSNESKEPQVIQSPSQESNPTSKE